MTLVTLALLVLLGVTPARGAEPIRVQVGDGLRAVEVAAPDLVTVLDAGTRRALFGIPGGRPIRVMATAGGGMEATWGVGGTVERRRLAMAGVRFETRRVGLRVGTRDYGGALEVWRNDGLLLVNELPLEEYIAGTVRAEAPERWPADALRALAVVARTFAVFHQQKNAGRPYHLVAGNQHQNFAGRIAEDSPAWDAARSTTGQVLTWQGIVFPAFYHSDSGGYTEPPQSIFSGEGIPPLPGVRDEFSTDSPNYSWATTLALSVVGERLRQGGVEVGDVRGINVLERSVSLRVVRLAVEHTRGTTILKGTDFRRLVGYDVLKSTLFVPVVVDGAVRFEGRGWGHGAGLSQFGAKGMAERGYAYPQILAYFYPGSALSTLR
jgi:stage II sporulation protein D (peptidoglycan lytic transglycosylase)